MKNKCILLTSAITLVLLETVEERMDEIYPQYIIYTLSTFIITTPTPHFNPNYLSRLKITIHIYYA